MAVRDYGVLKGRIVGAVMERDSGAPHYQIHVEAAGTEFRVAVNIRSRNHDNPELLFYVAENYQHVITDGLADLKPGFHFLDNRPESFALDYIRGNLLDRQKMAVLPHDLPGDENDLNEKMDMYVRRALGNREAFFYAFGSRWGPEEQPDHIFHFAPGNGVHNVHMNQGNPPGGHDEDNGVYQDGALFLHFPERNRWVAMFLAFQSQCWHTRDRNGVPTSAPRELGPAYQPDPTEPDYSVRILAALVNPEGDDAGKETITLLNTTTEPIDLDGWHLMDRGKRQMRLSGILLPGTPLTMGLSQAVNLSNNGGIITLLNPSGLKVHGVYYTKHAAREQGRPIVF